MVWTFPALKKNNKNDQTSPSWFSGLTWLKMTSKPGWVRDLFGWPACVPAWPAKKTSKFPLKPAILTYWSKLRLVSHFSLVLHWTILSYPTEPPQTHWPGQKSPLFESAFGSLTKWSWKDWWLFWGAIRHSFWKPKHTIVCPLVWNSNFYGPKCSCFEC